MEPKILFWRPLNQALPLKTWKCWESCLTSASYFFERIPRCFYIIMSLMSMVGTQLIKLWPTEANCIFLQHILITFHRTHNIPHYFIIISTHLIGQLIRGLFLLVMTLLCHHNFLSSIMHIRQSIVQYWSTNAWRLLTPILLVNQCLKIFMSPLRNIFHFLLFGMYDVSIWWDDWCS
jgi:hypothetical protein